jgi:hypothetical protein
VVHLLYLAEVLQFGILRAVLNIRSALRESYFVLRRFALFRLQKLLIMSK